MKCLLCFIIFYSLSSTIVVAQSLEGFFQDANLFFSTYVSDNQVAYGAIKKDAVALDKLVDFIKEAKVEEYSEAERKAFSINSYNLMVIKGVVAHYPIKSPLEVAGFFDKITYVIAGQETTLNDYEKKQLLHYYKDPRLHFVLVCAAVSCPPLRNVAYLPNQLEAQLTHQTKAAINNPNFIKVNSLANKVELSKIFEWYRKDFQPTILSFINLYKMDKLSESSSLSYYSYDWTLNDKEQPSPILHKPPMGKTAFVPIIAAATLPKGKFEINNFNTVYSADYEGGNTYSGLTSLFYFTYGINGRLDVSWDFIVASNRFGDAIGANPFLTFDFKNTPDNTSRQGRSISRSWGLSAMGPRVRFSPFKKLGISFEQAFYLPVSNIPFGNQVNENIFWVTQFYYDKQLHPKLGLFIALTFWQPLSPNPQVEFEFQVPYLRGFLTWFASNRFSLYATTTLFTEWGIGAKFLITPQFEIQALYSYYVPIKGLSNIYTKEAMDVMTFNLGLRYRI